MSNDNANNLFYDLSNILACDAVELKAKGIPTSEKGGSRGKKKARAKK